jgi:hypothetical protein
LQRGSTSAQRRARSSVLLPFVVSTPPVRANARSSAATKERVEEENTRPSRPGGASARGEDSPHRCSIGDNGRCLVPMPMLIGLVRTAGPFPAQRPWTMPSSASWTDVVCSSVSSSSARICPAIGLLFTSQFHSWVRRAPPARPRRASAATVARRSLAREALEPAGLAGQLTSSAYIAWSLWLIPRAWRCAPGRVWRDE